MTDRLLAEQAEALTRLLPRVFRQVHRHEAGDPASELPAGQLRVCAVLSDGPLTITALARELGTSVSAATQLADRVEAAGLVARGAEAEDRRVRRLTLTPQGAGLMQQRRKRRLARAAEVLGELSPKQRVAVLEALECLGEACFALSPEVSDGAEGQTLV